MIVSQACCETGLNVCLEKSLSKNSNSIEGYSQDLFYQLPSILLGEGNVRVMSLSRSRLDLQSSALPSINNFNLRQM